MDNSEKYYLSAQTAIVTARKEMLEESLSQFAKRFGVSKMAIKLYETGERKSIPPEILEFCYNLIYQYNVADDACPRCHGKGTIKKIVPSSPAKLVVNLRNRALWNDIEDYIDRKRTALASYEDIAKKHGVSRQRVEQVIKEIRNIK